MNTYEAWRISYQSSEAAARAAYNTVEKLHEENQALRKYVDGLQAALGAQVRFGSEGFLAAIEKLPRYTYGYKSDEWGMSRALTTYASEDGKFLLRDEVLAAMPPRQRKPHRPPIWETPHRNHLRPPKPEIRHRERRTK